MLPDLSHLQFAILDILRDKPRSGKFVREELAKRDLDRSGPMFYQIMSRLEDSGYVEGWYEQKEIGGVAVRERTYKMTGEGARAAQAARDFYLKSMSFGLQGG